MGLTFLPVEQQMSEEEVAFKNLKENISRKLEDSIDLEKVKEFFSGIIQSRRRLSEAENLNDIFYLLEIRDALDFDNVCILEDFATLLQNEEILNLIRGYKKLYISSDYVVCNCGERLSYTLPAVNIEENPFERKYFHDLYFIFKTIAHNIGKNWRILASELKVPECYVDEVREKYPEDFYLQAFNILEIWRQHNGKEATMEVLKEALDSRLCKLKGIGLHMLTPKIDV